MNGYKYIICELTTKTTDFIAANLTFIDDNRVLNCKNKSAPAIHSEISERWVCTHFFCVFVSNDQNEIAEITANCTVVESLSIENFHKKYLPA